MPKETVTRRQKDVARLLRERRQAQKDKLIAFKRGGNLKKLYIFLILGLIISNLIGCATTVKGFTEGTGKTVLENMITDIGDSYEVLQGWDEKFREVFW